MLLHYMPGQSTCMYCKLTLLPALVAAGDTGKKKEWRNPFLPYEQALWVANMGGERALVWGQHCRSRSICAYKCFTWPLRHMA